MIFLTLIIFSLEMEIGKRISAAMSMRNDPTCSAEKIAVPSSANIPFFIKMNELPQMQASRISNNQLIDCFDMFLKSESKVGIIIFWKINFIIFVETD